jgi:arylsulfatase A-like enzyme
VHQEIFRHYGHAYDMHENNFSMLKNHNLPILDRVYPTLIQDLKERGLLDSTLVIVMGEMGRSPRINVKAGRDHWPQCGFSLLTGGGVKAGMVYGATDKHAGYPVSNPVHPADLVATVYHLLGIDPHFVVRDRLGRPFPVARGGEPIQGILA